MNTVLTWSVLLATSAACYLIKLVGYLVPARWLANARFQRINTLIPVVLLSALVVTQAVAVKSHLVIDPRMAGVGAALAALVAKAPFPVVVLCAALTSALVYRLS
ncbi:MAG: AzlD domain-containing protein [Actinomycetota bacterium]|nr:AzlD domain-containing protein [Actinomycetota bacterium]